MRSLELMWFENVSNGHFCKNVAKYAYFLHTSLLNAHQIVSFLFIFGIFDFKLCYFIILLMPKNKNGKIFSRHYFTFSKTVRAVAKVLASAQSFLANQSRWFHVFAQWFQLFALWFQLFCTVISTFCTVLSDKAQSSQPIRIEDFWWSYY